MIRSSTSSWSKRLKRDKCRWPNPQDSIGTWYRKMGMDSSCWEAVGTARQTFDRIAEEIKVHLEKHSDPVPETVTWTMYMIGRTKETAEPMIMFCCKESSCRKRVRKTFDESGILDKYPGVRVGDCSRPPDFDRLVQLAGETLVSSETIHELSLGEIEEAKARRGSVLREPSALACGSRIFLSKAGNSPALRRATAGGIIRLGDRYLYLTVSHAFADLLDHSQASATEEVDSDFEFDIGEETDSDQEEAELIETTSRGSLSPELGSYASSDDIATSVSVLSDLSRNPSRVSDSGSCEKFPAEENDTMERPQSSETDHSILSLEHVGRLFMESKDLDYALVEINNPELQTFNRITVNDALPVQILCPEGIVYSLPSNVNVIAATGSAGVLRGIVSATPSFVMFPGTTLQHELWTVRLDGTLADGDCGSWVVDAASGDLLGHVVSGSPETGVAYIVPAYLIFQDVSGRSGMEPKLARRAMLGGADVSMDGGSPDFSNGVEGPQTTGREDQISTVYAKTDEPFEDGLDAESCHLGDGLLTLLGVPLLLKTPMKSGCDLDGMSHPKGRLLLLNKRPESVPSLPTSNLSLPRSSLSTESPHLENVHGSVQNSGIMQGGKTSNSQPTAGKKKKKHLSASSFLSDNSSQVTAPLPEAPIKSGGPSLQPALRKMPATVSPSRPPRDDVLYTSPGYSVAPSPFASGLYQNVSHPYLSSPISSEPSAIRLETENLGPRAVQTLNKGSQRPSQLAHRIPKRGRTNAQNDTYHLKPKKHSGNKPGRGNVQRPPKQNSLGAENKAVIRTGSQATLQNSALDDTRPLYRSDLAPRNTMPLSRPAQDSRREISEKCIEDRKPHIHDSKIQSRDKNENKKESLTHGQDNKESISSLTADALLRQQHGLTDHVKLSGKRAMQGLSSISERSSNISTNSRSLPAKIEPIKDRATSSEISSSSNSSRSLLAQPRSLYENMRRGDKSNVGAQSRLESAPVIVPSHGHPLQSPLFMGPGRPPTYHSVTTSRSRPPLSQSAFYGMDYYQTPSSRPPTPYGSSRPPATYTVAPRPQQSGRSLADRFAPINRSSSLSDLQAASMRQKAMYDDDSVHKPASVSQAIPRRPREQKREIHKSYINRIGANDSGDSPQPRPGPIRRYSNSRQQYRDEPPGRIFTGNNIEFMPPSPAQPIVQQAAAHYCGPLPHLGIAQQYYEGSLHQSSDKDDHERVPPRSQTIPRSAIDYTQRMPPPPKPMPHNFVEYPSRTPPPPKPMLRSVIEHPDVEAYPRAPSPPGAVEVAIEYSGTQMYSGGPSSYRPAQKPFPELHSTGEALLLSELESRRLERRHVGSTKSSQSSGSRTSGSVWSASSRTTAYSRDDIIIEPAKINKKKSHATLRDG